MLGAGETRDGLFGASPAMGELRAYLAKVALSDATVLVTGETGTGKERVAQAVHRLGPRAAAPFVAVNCAAIPETLIESELFGHRRGAFTGATGDFPGRFAEADRGTLFLDEIGELSFAGQAKLLRALEEREIAPVGSTSRRKVDVRVVAATNAELEELVVRRAFRADLYYRLNVVRIDLPALRDRPEDIGPIVDHFIAQHNHRRALRVGRPDGELLGRMRRYDWPGNVRELRNAVERAVILCEGGLITSEHLPMSLGRAPILATIPDPGEIPGGGIDLEAVERSYVEQALKQAGNNKSKAARLLGLTRAQLYSRLEKYGL